MVNYAKRVLHFCVWHPGRTLSTTQLHVWSLAVGLVLGVFVTGYGYAIEGMLEVLWRLLPQALARSGLMGPHARLGTVHLNWLIPLLYGGGGAGLLIWIFRRFKLRTGSVITAIRGLHNHGKVEFRFFFPMLFVSLVTITAGGSAGPEAACIIFGGALTELLNRLLRQPLRERRILTLSGMSAGLSAFFGMPLSGALFVLEVPHHNGLEYFEAISPAVCASVSASLIKKLITQEPLGGRVNYMPMPELNFVALAIALLLGLLAGITALAFIAWMKALKWLLNDKVGMHRYPLPLSILGGGLIGLFGVLAPSSLFWSENELQWAVSLGNATLPYAEWPGVLPFASPPLPWQLAVDGMIKLVTIGITVQCGWPGGIIFPLFFAGALFGQAWALLLGTPSTVGVTTFMSALMAAVLRTPWASVLIVLLTSAGATGTHFVETFPLMIISVMVAMVMVYYTRLYGKEQHGRRDLVPGPDLLPDLVPGEDESGGLDDEEETTVSALFNRDYGDPMYYDAVNEESALLSSTELRKRDAGGDSINSVL